jgi:hypothetical protein
MSLFSSSSIDFVMDCFVGILGPSPVEDYLLFIHMDQEDDISRDDREAARKVTGMCTPLLYDFPSKKKLKKVLVEAFAFFFVRG